MENFDVRAIELLMDNMGQGVVYVDRDRRIQTCSQRAKEITGIVIDAKASHESGRLAEYVRNLGMFLRDFCMASWNADRMKDAEIEKIKKRLDALEGK